MTSVRRFMVGDKVWCASPYANTTRPFRTEVVGYAGNIYASGVCVWCYHIPHPQHPASGLKARVFEPMLVPVSAIDLLGELA